MPIWKNEKDNVLMIETGFGDVSFSTGKTPDKDYSDELLFSQGPDGEIGREDTHMVGKSSVEAGTACRVVFHKRASLDVLLERLNYLRSQMPDDAPSAPSEEPRGGAVIFITQILLDCHHFQLEAEVPAGEGARVVKTLMATKSGRRSRIVDITKMRPVVARMLQTLLDEDVVK